MTQIRLSNQNLSTLCQVLIGIFDLQFLCVCVIISYKTNYLGKSKHKQKVCSKLYKSAEQLLFTNIYTQYYS